MNVLGATLSVFSVILVGFASSRFRYTSEAVEKGLTEFVFKVSVPALIFVALTRQGLEGQVQPSFWLAYFGGCAIVWTICALVARKWLGQPARAALLLGFSTSQSNTVFVGVPLILSVYGDAGALPLFMLLALHMPVMMGAATFLVEAKGQASWLQNIQHLFKTLFANPIFLALIAGGVFHAMQWQLPTALHEWTQGFAATASICALFALGCSVHRFGIFGHAQSVVLVCSGKLILHPLVVWILATYVFSMPAVFSGVATTFAAMPVGINAYLLASKYKAGEGAIAASVTLSTLLSILTCTVWLSILGH